MDSGFAGLVSGYSEELLVLYEMTGQQEAYREELIWHVYHCSQNNLTYILKLKDLCTEAEWEQERERLLASKATWGVHYKLLENEKCTSSFSRKSRSIRGSICSISMRVCSRSISRTKSEISMQITWRDGRSARQTESLTKDR